MKNLLAIIGGSGVKDSPTFKDAQWNEVFTGIGTGDGSVAYQRDGNVIFIPRHGRDHQYSPSQVNYKANILAASMLGARAIIGTSAVGALNETWKVGSLFVPSDYVDETGRDDNLFGNGFTVHASPRPAFSPQLRKTLTQNAKGHFDAIYGSGVYCCIPGDRFGTKAEGKKRKAYADIVGMTVCPESSLAMQAGIHYAAACFIVDLDHDANHEGGTLAVMQRLSEPERVPAYIDKVVQETLLNIDQFGTLDQLSGNIIDTGKCSGPPGLIELRDRLRSEYL